MEADQHLATVRDPSVVVGVDGSAGARHAFRWAIEEARLRRARLRAVYAWEPPQPISPIGSIVFPHDIPGAEQSEKQLLEDAIDDVLQHARPPFREIEPLFERGYPPKVLIDHVGDGDLLVVGSRGLGGFSGLLLGSVSQHCVNRATEPVIVVPASAPLPDGTDVVVGVDGSHHAKAALRFAVAEAAVRGARLVVAHSLWDSAARFGFMVSSKERRALTAHAHMLLEHMTDGAIAHAGRPPASVELVLVEAPPALGLLDAAKSAGLLVVGSRGRGRYAGLFLGSVSQQCVHHSTCAVAVVPHHEP